MKICVYGAGAIGGWIGFELAKAGSDVSFIARGPHLDAMRRNGLTLLMNEERRVARVVCTDDPAELGAQDYVLLTLKSHSVPPVVDAMQPLLGPQTTVVTAQNGVPWWYFYRLEGPWNDLRLASVDPGGRLWEGIGAERAIGCVVYPSCVVEEPGVIRHIQGNRLMLGEPDGSRSERVLAMSRALSEAGFKAPVRERIRDDIWLKLWGNASFNPISVLTAATLEQITDDVALRGIIRTLMLEAQAVGERLGARFLVDVETRISWAARVGAHKTSMLQDLEQGRPMEIDALIGAVAEMGRLVDVATPTIDLVLGLVQLRARVAAQESG